MREKKVTNCTEKKLGWHSIIYSKFYYIIYRIYLNTNYVKIQALFPKNFRKMSKNIPRFIPLSGSTPNLMKSNLGRDPASIQVSWKSVQ